MAYDVFMDGFEYPQLRWDNVVAMAVSSVGRVGQCVAAFSAASGCEKAFPAAKCFTVGAAVKVAAMPVVSTPLYVFYDGEVVQGYLALAPDGKLEYYVGSELIGVSASSLVLGRWHYIEAGVKVDNTNGTFKLQVDNTTQGWIPEVTGATQVTANASIDKLSLVYMDPGFNTAQLYFDDLYVAYGDELVFFGDSQVGQLIADADGDIDEWIGSDGNTTDNFRMVLGLNTAIDTEVDGSTSLFQMSNIPINPAVIHAVQVSAISRNTFPTDRNLTFVAKSNGVTSPDALFPWTTGDKFFYRTFLKDPGTDAAWTKTGVNALQVGVKMRLPEP